MTVLKPCPFCGGESVLRKWYERGNHIGASHWRIEIECVNECLFDAFESPDESITAWNTRTNEQQGGMK